MRKRQLAAVAAIAISVTAFSEVPAFAGTPGEPTNLSTSPTPLNLDGTAQPCGTGVAFAGMENINGVEEVGLSATLNWGTATNNLSARFSASDLTTGTTFAPIYSIGQATGGTPVSVWLPVVNGHEYKWSVAETDGTTWSATAGPCDFISDTTAPSNPTVSSTDFPANGGGLDSGEPGSFTVSSSDPAPALGKASGVKGYIYWLDSGTPSSVTPAGNTDGSLVLSNESFSWGQHTLYVQAVDYAGNRSAVSEYSFFVAQNPDLSPKLTLKAFGPEAVSADGTGSTGLWTITQCSLNFGDGSAPVTGLTASACTAEHEYANYGTYPVTLTITDQYGNTKSVTEDFTTSGLSKGTLFHEVVANQQVGLVEPVGSTGIAQASITAMPNGDSQLVAVTSGGVLEHNIRYANGGWQGWRTISQPGVSVENASIAGMPNGSSQIVEVTSTGVLEHNIRNANGSWQPSGWASPGSPSGTTTVIQASITAMPNGSSVVAATYADNVVAPDIRNADGGWSGWGQIFQNSHITSASDVSVAGMPNGSWQLIEVSGI